MKKLLITISLISAILNSCGVTNFAKYTETISTEQKELLDRIPYKATKITAKFPFYSTTELYDEIYNVLLQNDFTIENENKDKGYIAAIILKNN